MYAWCMVYGVYITYEGFPRRKVHNGKCWCWGNQKMIVLVVHIIRFRVIVDVRPMQVSE